MERESRPKVLPLVHGYKPSMQAASRLNILQVPGGIEYSLQSSEHFRFVIVTGYHQIIGFNTVSEIRKRFGFGWIRHYFIKYVGISKAQ